MRTSATTEAPAAAASGSRSMMKTPSPPLKLNVSPYRGSADFTALDRLASDRAFDPVSIADLLRNAFVYPPHSIYRDVKVAGLGFDPEDDLHASPGFRFPYRSAPAPARPSEQAVDEGTLLRTYHRLLREAVQRSTAAMRAPWMLQSGGKDSTSLAIAVAEARPETTCLTYLGGREEDEVATARAIAGQLGLRHEALVCDPARAYDRYLAMIPRMPLLSADFALLSYADLATEVAARGGDGIIDGLGSDVYFGTPVDLRRRLIALLARGAPLPSKIFQSGLVSGSFKTCFVLATVAMDAFERLFPGSRFSDTEVDELLGEPLAQQSRGRLRVFQRELAEQTAEGRRRISLAIAEAGAAFPKGQNTTSALGLGQAYPFCDDQLSQWVYTQVPDALLIDSHGHNKPLVRAHISRRFGELPYVDKGKGSFRFDLCGLAAVRFERVHAFALEARHIMPGAMRWLEKNRGLMGNKFFASKFYLLAVTLPWLLSRAAETADLFQELMDDQ